MGDINICLSCKRNYSSSEEFCKCGIRLSVKSELNFDSLEKVIFAMQSSQFSMDEKKDIVMNFFEINKTIK